MDSELKGNSLDQLIGYYEHSSAESQISILKESYSISDFNNVETADRKLIINNKLEFWVHDFVLNTYCDYFRLNIEAEQSKKSPNNNQNSTKNLLSQKNNILIKEFNTSEDELLKLNKTEETNINNINNINNTNNNNNSYSKYILKNSNTNIKQKRSIKDQKNIKKEKPKDIINIKEEKTKRKNSDIINKSNIEVKELIDIINTSETTTIKDDIKDIKITRINIPNKNE